MNNKRISKEIKVRLNKVCCLLKEIEDILCKNENEDQMGQLSKYDYSCTCVCGKQSVPEVLEKVSNHSKDDDSKKCEKMHKPCFKKHIKCKDLDREKMSSVINDISPCCQNNYEKNHKKDDLKSPNNICCNKKNYNNNTQNDCKHELFKNEINYIKQKYMSYFDEIDKNDPNTAVCSTINSKKTP
ncbi:uncharacterized protein LOC112593675, partial [Melanaphis sacchari]|uniref:uncharacterized protein LOC112593675 n=1 Tax=Melanaphis sacchari TaxID=742174 RepID=UPI000DC14710